MLWLRPKPLWVAIGYGYAVAGGEGNISNEWKLRTSVDEHIVSSQLEEASDILEDEREAVVLPIVGVIGELDGSLDICGNYKKI